MDNETPAKESFGKTLAKGAALNAAGTIGMFGGLIIVGTIAEALKKRRHKSCDTTES